MTSSKDYFKKPKCKFKYKKNKEYLSVSQSLTEWLLSPCPQAPQSTPSPPPLCSPGLSGTALPSSHSKLGG